MRGRASILYSEMPKLDGLPDEYLEFADVFNKNRSKQLPPHCDHDLSIQIEEGAKLPLVLRPNNSGCNLRLKA